MSCKLITQEEWLEYPSGASLLNKVLLVSIAAIGGILFGFELWLENQIKNCQISNNTSNLMRALQIISIIMVLIPVLLFVIDYATTNKVTKVNLAFPAAALMAALSAALVIVFGALQASIPSACNLEWPMWTWIPVGGLAAVSFGLLLYRWKSSSADAPAKQKIDWSNYAISETLIKELGRKQGKQCGVEIGPEESLLSFANYIQTHKTKPTGWFSSFKTATATLPASTQEKYPNIARMYAALAVAQKSQGKSWLNVPVNDVLQQISWAKQAKIAAKPAFAEGAKPAREPFPPIPRLPQEDEAEIEPSTLIFNNQNTSPQNESYFSSLARAAGKQLNQLGF